VSGLPGACGFEYCERSKCVSLPRASPLARFAPNRNICAGKSISAQAVRCVTGHFRIPPGFLAELHALGIAFVTLGEGIDATTPAGCLQLHVLAAIAEFERNTYRGTRQSRARSRQGRRPARRPTAASGHRGRRRADDRAERARGCEGAARQPRSRLPSAGGAFRKTERRGAGFSPRER
jgi:hypothetical protein